MINRDFVAIDTETAGLNWSDETLCVSAGKPGGESAFLNLGYRQHANLFGLAFGEEANKQDRALVPLTNPEARAALWEFMEGVETLVFHNGSFDIPRIVRAGLITEEEMAGFSIFDTMVMARCTGPHDAATLDAVFTDYGLQSDDSWRGTKSQRKNMANMPIDKVEAYARSDAIYTAKLAELMMKKAAGIYEQTAIDEDGRWVLLVSKLQLRGLLVDQQALSDIREARAADLRTVMQAINDLIKPYRVAGPNDRKTILSWVRDGLGQSRHLNRTGKGNESLDEASLKNLVGPAKPVVSLILRARHIEKEIATWVDGVMEQMAEDGRVHPLYTAAGTITNRLSCSRPNAQAFPGKWFDVCFRAEEGRRIVQVDYSQVELRLAAMFAGENALAAEFAKEDADPHMATAKLMFGENATKEDRQIAKSSNFLSIYGGGPFRLMEQANVNEEKARQLLDRHKRALPAIARARKNAEKIWLNRGYLRTLGDKHIYMRPSDKERSYKAFNALIQPAVAELIKKAMLAIDEKLYPQVRLIGQVHDSIIAEIEEDGLAASIQRVRGLMERALPTWLSERTNPHIVLHTDVKMRGENG